jgi:hypothetical protein
MTDRVTGWPYEWFLFVHMAISGCKLVQALFGAIKDQQYGRSHPGSRECLAQRFSPVRPQPRVSHSRKQVAAWIGEFYGRDRHRTAGRSVRFPSRREATTIIGRLSSRTRSSRQLASLWFARRQLSHKMKLLRLQISSKPIFAKLEFVMLALSADGASVSTTKVETPRAAPSWRRAWIKAFCAPRFRKLVRVVPPPSQARS